MRRKFDSVDFLSKIGAGKTICRCLKGQALFTQGDSADAVFYLQDGKVKMTVTSQGGKEAVVALVEKGSFFGEGCLNGHPRRLATASALTEVSAMRISKVKMLRVLKDEGS